jgi:hypothetical protein
MHSATRAIDATKCCRMECIISTAFAIMQINQQNRYELTTRFFDLVYPGGCTDTSAPSAVSLFNRSRLLAQISSSQSKTSTAKWSVTRWKTHATV